MAKIREAREALEAEAASAAAAKAEAESAAEEKRQAETRKRSGPVPRPPSKAPDPKVQRNFTDALHAEPFRVAQYEHLGRYAGVTGLDPHVLFSWPSGDEHDRRKRHDFIFDSLKIRQALIEHKNGNIDYFWKATWIDIASVLPP